MAKTIFKDISQELGQLIGDIDLGKLALPDIQRPFVWKKTQVRDLLDSMYRGFPVGYLMIWRTSDSESRTIGTGGKQFDAERLIIDGQQRLTSLYAVMKGSEVVFENFSRGRIRIAFRPKDGKFDVTDAAIEKDPEYLPDVSRLWVEEDFEVTDEFLERLQEQNPEALEGDRRANLRRAISRLVSLQDYPLQSVEIGSDVDEEQVAEIFLRVNSGGQKLKQSDFILTLLSVFRESDRRRLEAFAEASASGPSLSKASPFNHLVEPRPDQLLRSAILLGFKRGQLSSILSLLRGADPDGGTLDESARTRHLDTLTEAITRTLDLSNWHEFLKVVKTAGYRRAKEISSVNAIMYSYAIYLIGRFEFGLTHGDLRTAIARYFFMTALSGRYSGSSETQVTEDVRAVSDVRNGIDFLGKINGITQAVLTNDFWSTTLPLDLQSSSFRGPALYAYAASLNLIDARVPPFGTAADGEAKAPIPFRDLTDPAINSPKEALERHHLFPRAYLERQGIATTREINQIANLAYVEWPENIEISDKSPSEYWPPLAANFGEEDLFAHALPVDWHLMEYEEFLQERRHMIAAVIRRGFESISATGESEVGKPEEVPTAEASLNQRLVARILGSLEGTVTWWDRSVTAETLALLLEELNLENVEAIRLLSDAPGEQNAVDFFDDFSKEMIRKNIEVEWRMTGGSAPDGDNRGMICDDDEVFLIPKLGFDLAGEISPDQRFDDSMNEIERAWDSATSPI